MEPDLELLKYPIGRYQPQAEISPEQINTWIAELADLPKQLKAAVEDLNDAQLDTPYRPEGWTLRQVVHHLPDSHLNAYIRFKLALTEENPSIKPYKEALWAECTEAQSGPVAVSLALLDNLHQRWVLYLKTLKIEDFERTYFHPEQQKTVALKNVLGLYAWHGAHHLEHIKQTRKRNNWL